MIDYYELASGCSYQDFLKVLDADIRHLICYGRPKISSWDRKATFREFYGVILLSLQQLHGDSMELNVTHEVGYCLEMTVKKRLEYVQKLVDLDLEGKDESGICLEPCTKMVVPTCCHTMCINCYHDWNTRSESCPFCWGSLKRVNSGDLWVKMQY